MFRKGFALDYIREPDRESVGDDASASRCSTIKIYIRPTRIFQIRLDFSDLRPCFVLRTFLYTGRRGRRPLQKVKAGLVRIKNNHKLQLTVACDCFFDLFLCLSDCDFVCREDEDADCYQNKRSNYEGGGCCREAVNQLNEKAQGIRTAHMKAGKVG